MKPKEVKKLISPYLGKRCLFEVGVGQADLWAYVTGQQLIIKFYDSEVLKEFLTVNYMDEMGSECLQCADEDNEWNDKAILPVAAVVPVEEEARLDNDDDGDDGDDPFLFTARAWLFVDLKRDDFFVATSDRWDREWRIASLGTLRITTGPA